MAGEEPLILSARDGKGYSILLKADTSTDESSRMVAFFLPTTWKTFKCTPKKHHPTYSHVLTFFQYWLRFVRVHLKDNLTNITF